MVKINNVVAATVISLLSASPSYAYIHEGKWEFQKDEVQIINMTRPGMGLDVGCSEFSPAKVSFKVTVLAGQEQVYGWMNIDDRPYYEKEYVFKNVSGFEIGFFSTRKYRIENITGQKVKCVKGDIGLLD